MKLIQYYILLLFTLIALTVRAQLYPVQVVPTVNAPYSSKLADYANPLGGRMQLQLITTDLNIQNRSVQLHLEIKGNGLKVQSLPILNVRTLRISGGEITSLSQSDLAPYFKPENLQGLSMQQYAQPLPDGVYSFCWRVRDVQSGKWLSGSQCATIYLMLNDPPQLNLPTDNERVAVGNFPNIIFSWTPRHLNATNVTYEFELCELLDPSLDPRFAFEVSRKVLKESDLRMTTLLYDLSKPNLIPGHRYGWRVRAVSTAGLVQNSVFKNDGYSEVHSFVYASDCKAPWGLVVTEESPARIRLQWQGDSAHRQYHIQYRKANVVGAEWFDTNTKGTEAYLTDLEGGETYEARVGASCELPKYGTKPSYTYGAITRFEVKKSPTATDNGINCGVASEIKITDRKPLASLVVNETFTANDFTVKVLEVSGDNGVFTGKGYVEVPFLSNAKLAVVFNNIQINSSHQLIGGVVEAAYNKSWSDVVDFEKYVDNIFDKREQIYKEVEELNKQLNEKKIDQQEYEQLLNEKNKAYQETVPVLKKTTEELLADSAFQSKESINTIRRLEVPTSIDKTTAKDIAKLRDKDKKAKKTLIASNKTKKLNELEELELLAKKIRANKNKEDYCNRVKEYKEFQNLGGGKDIKYLASAEWKTSYGGYGGTLFFLDKANKTVLLHTGDELGAEWTSEVRNKEGYYYLYSSYFEDGRFRQLKSLPSNYKDVSLEPLFKEIGKAVGRYILPIEDIQILIDGKDFEGEKASRTLAGGFIVLTVVPGEKIAQPVKAIARGMKGTFVTLTKEGKKLVLKSGIPEEVFKLLEKGGEKAAKVGGKVLPKKVSTLISSLKSSNKYNAKTLEYVENFLKGFDAKKLEKLAEVPGFDKVVEDMATYGKKFAGGKFQLEYFAKIIDNLKGSLRFEVPQSIIDATGKEVARVYDAIVEYGGKITKYEMKNWAKWYPSTIKNQFIKDLQSIKNLDELKWVFNTTSGVTKANLKSKIISTLRKADGKPIEELERLFKNEDIVKKLKNIFGEDIKTSKDILNKLNDDKIFNQIFEIVE